MSSHSGALTFSLVRAMNDDRVLAVLRRPPPRNSQADIVMVLCDLGRERPVRRAVEEGILRLESNPEPVNAVAAAACRCSAI